MRACTFERTSAVSLADRRSAEPARTGLVSGTSLPHSPALGDDIALFLPIPLAFLFPPVRYAPSPALSLLFSFPSLPLGRSKEAKVEANHHAITAPGAAGTPTRSQKAATAFCRPGAFTTAVPVLQNQQSSSCAAEKRALPSPRPGYPAPFRQITGGPTDRPTTGIRGIHRENSRDSTTAVPIERRGRHALNPRRQLPRRHDTARDANMLEKKYILG